MPNVPLESQDCPCKQDCSCNMQATFCCCDQGNPGNPICGCTNPNDPNYDPNANKDDCSCCHHYPNHPGCSGAGAIEVKKLATRKAGLEGYANLIGPSMIVIDNLLE